MKKIMAGVLLLAACLFGAPQAQAQEAKAPPVTAQETHAEHLECYNPTTFHTVYADLDYSLFFVGGNDWDVLVSGEVHTYPNFNMDKWWLDIETAPNTWLAVAHYGGDGTPQNTVSTDWLLWGGGTVGTTITNDSDSPAWRMRAWGVGSGNSTYYCSDFGTVF